MLVYNLIVIDSIKLFIRSNQNEKESNYMFLSNAYIVDGVLASVFVVYKL